MSSPDVVGVKVEFDIPAFTNYSEKIMDQVVAQCGRVLVRDIKLSFTMQAGSRAGGNLEGGGEKAVGDIYIKSNKGRRARVHQASAPDQSPAVDSGRLRTSISTFYDRAAKTAYVGTPVEYAASLEFGNYQSVYVPGHFRKVNDDKVAWVDGHTMHMNIAPRPFFRPAVSKYYGNNRLMETVVADLKKKGIL